MIRLRDILLEDESEAAKEAKRQGLESLGFGRWGKDGKVTHITRLGKLVPFTSTDTQTANTTQQSKPQSTTEPSVGTSQSSEKPNSDSNNSSQSSTHGIGRRRTYNVTGLSDVASSVGSTLGNDMRVADVGRTLSAVTGHFGRESAPQIQRGGPGIDFLNQHYGDEDTVAVYNGDTDTIELGTNTVDIPDTPVSEWDESQITSFKTHVHETIHSTSPRVKPGSTFMHSGIGLSIEEGLTEYLAQSIVDSTVRPHNPRVDGTNSGEGYRGFVDGIELMSSYGGLDVDSTFRETDEETVRNNIFNSQTNAINSTLERAGISTEQGNPLRDRLMYVNRQYLKNDSLLLMDEKVAAVFVHINREFDEGRSMSPEEVTKMIMEVLK